MKTTRILVLAAGILALAFSGCAGAREGQKKESAVAMPDSVPVNHQGLVLFMEALSAQNMGKDSTAAVLYRESLRLDPTNTAARFNLARLFAQNNQPGEALAFATQAYEADPENIFYGNFLASLYAQTGQLERAESVLKSMIERNPENIDLRFELSSVLIDAKQYEDAIEQLNYLETRIGISEEISIQKQVLYREMGRPDKALEEMEALARSNPGEMRFLGMLAETYESEGRDDKAREVYARMEAIDPSSAYLNLALSEYHFRKNENAEGYNRLEKAFLSGDIDIESKLGVLVDHYSRAPGDSARQAQTIRLAEVLDGRHPNDARLKTLLGDLYAQKNEYIKAANMYRAALSLDPDQFNVWTQLVNLDFQQSAFDSALVHAREMIALFPAQPTSYLFAGIAHNVLKQPHDAIAQLEAGKELVVDNRALLAEFYANLGDAYHAVENHGQSDNAYRKSLELNPSNAHVLNNFSYYLAIRGENLEEAERMAKRANDLSPNTASFQDTYGWVLFKRANYQNARFWLEQALQNGGSGEREILEHYGDVLWHLKQEDLARENWQKALDATGTGSVELQRKVEEGRYISPQE